MSQEAMRFEDVIARDGQLIYSFKGISMLPLLRQGRDLIVVEKLEGRRFKRGEVALFKRGSGYVLHRVIKVYSKSYDCLGDNSVYPDRNIKESDMLGVMTAYIRDGKKHSVEELPYRLYAHLVLLFNPLRVLYRRMKGKVKRLLGGK